MFSTNLCFEEGIFVALTYRLQKIYNKLRFHITPSIRTENGVRHVVISAQAGTTFVLLYFCHFRCKNKDSREQSNHVSYRAPTPYQRSGM